MHGFKFECNYTNSLNPLCKWYITTMFFVTDTYAMPGPTTKNNPWSEELKKSRRKSSKGISGNEGNKADSPPEKTRQIDDGGGDDRDGLSQGAGGGGTATPLNLGETKEMATKPPQSKDSKQQYLKEKAGLDEKVVAKSRETTTAPAAPAAAVPKTRETTAAVAAVKKCVNDNVRPVPKVKPPSLPYDGGLSRSLYQDARNHLRPAAKMLSRQMSKDNKLEEEIPGADAGDNHDTSETHAETPVDRLIRLDQTKPNHLTPISIPLVKSLSKGGDDKGIHITYHSRYMLPTTFLKA